MPNSPNPASREATLDLSQLQNLHSRRARPPNPNAETGDASRVPLKAEAGDKARWRESRLGLRNIFGRSKGETEADKRPVTPRTVTPRNLPQRPAGIRASLAEINWPYSSNNAQGHRSEVTLPSASKPSAAAPSLKHKKSETGVRPQPNSEWIAAWNQPPLFKAYPQAIKHAHLPACTVPAEVVLRMHNHKNSGSLSSILSPSTIDIEESTSDKSKKRHRRNGSGSTSKFEWTTKVFVLVTSGYLLQYAGEGSFDRLPERILQLGKDSAAFASDAIPGRHWVLQVSSAAESDRAAGTALRARLPFRAQERKASTFLMVFEGAGDMDSWIATLRREIESLGGRKVLSETGKPLKTASQDLQLRNQASQRTLVVRDPDRFSRVMNSDQSCHRSSVISTDSRLDPSQDDTTRELSCDDNSTASVISRESRQLDSLRDSTNRLSYMSSGQRTMLTSVGSSPACSPIRDSFGELDTLPAELPQLDEPQPRLRPNAMAIIDRRQSLQTANHVMEMRVASAQTLRPSSTYSNSGQPEQPAMPFVPPQPMPNFSVPHNAGKRFSFARTSMGMQPTHITSSPLLGRMSARRPPPSALAINPRPLSLVEDQPSPALSVPSRAASGTESTGSPLSSAPITPLGSSSSTLAENDVTVRETRGEQGQILETSRKERLQSSAPQTDRRPLSLAMDTDPAKHNPVPFSKSPPRHLREMPRSMSSLGTYGGSRPPPQVNSRPVSRTRGQSFTIPKQPDAPTPLTHSPSPLPPSPSFQGRPKRRRPCGPSRGPPSISDSTRSPTTRYRRDRACRSWLMARRLRRRQIGRCRLFRRGRG